MFQGKTKTAAAVITANLARAPSRRNNRVRVDSPVNVREGALDTTLHVPDEPAPRLVLQEECPVLAHFNDAQDLISDLNAERTPRDLVLGVHGKHQVPHLKEADPGPVDPGSQGAEPGGVVGVCDA